jgi:hypothetical protein
MPLSREGRVGHQPTVGVGAKVVMMMMMMMLQLIIEL